MGTINLYLMLLTDMELPHTYVTFAIVTFGMAGYIVLHQTCIEKV